MAKNLYETLGVAKGASDDELKKAYRKLTKSLHPDLNPDDKRAEERFKAVSAAYDILGKKEKRGQYDRGEIDESGAEKAQYQQYGGGNPYQNRGGFGGQEDMGDIFSQMFQQRQARPVKGQDMRLKLRISFMDAALGGKQQVLLENGSYLTVPIPKGIEDGKTIRLKGKGHASMNGGLEGDAMVELTVIPDAVYTRNGLNIELTLPITIYEAALGGKVEVPTIHGAVGVKIPAGTNTGKTLRLKGRGIDAKSGKGDQMVTLAVQMPDEPDAELQAFLKDWAETHAYDPRAKIKDAAQA